MVMIMTMMGIIIGMLCYAIMGMRMTMVRMARVVMVRRRNVTEDGGDGGGEEEHDACFLAALASLGLS